MKGFGRSGTASSRKPVVKKTSKTVSSVKYCEQKFACRSDKEEAEFECSNCDAKYQCYQCKEGIHKTKYSSHLVEPIVKPKRDELCWHVSCTRKNYVNLWCPECSKNYCFDCSRQLHMSLTRKHHSPLKIEEHRANLERESERKANLEHESDVFLSLDSSSPPFSSPPPSFPSMSSVNEYPQYTDQMPVARVSPVTSMNRSSSPKPGGAQLIKKPESEPAVLDVSTCSDTNTIYTTDAASDESLTPRKSTDEAVDGLKSVCLYGNEGGKAETESVLLIDEKEAIKIENAADFAEKLGCSENCTVKVLSIVGNTGDGKSHTLNHAFFGGSEVFKTSADPSSCTMGVWAAYNKDYNVILVDTEGLLGISSNSNQRRRLLLKVLALSDVVVFRTRAERLHTDMFQFISDASCAYQKYFSTELETAARRAGASLAAADMGPFAVVFHETRDTRPLVDKRELIQRFRDQNLAIEAFRRVEYIGVKTGGGQTDFQPFKSCAAELIKDSNFRSPRSLHVIYKLLKHLNEKFSESLPSDAERSFPDEYFTCRSECQACRGRCGLAMKHSGDHQNDKKCQYVAKIDNKVYICTPCVNNGLVEEMIPKPHSSDEGGVFAWVNFTLSGYVLECRKHGVVYRSRQHWIGNTDPDSSVARIDIRHAWPEAGPVAGGSHNAAQRLVDTMGSLGEVLSEYTQPATRAVRNMVNDQIRPDYWVADSDITNCVACRRPFGPRDPIHHCRRCGKGVCDECSPDRRPVPERDWFEPVRVCKRCVEPNSIPTESGDGSTVTARKVTETVTGAIQVLASTVSLATDQVKASARPRYWVPDEECKACVVCTAELGLRLPIHHCRACGRGVCNACSLARLPVPQRGWQSEVRVCDSCVPRLQQKQDE